MSNMEDMPYSLEEQIAAVRGTLDFLEVTHQDTCAFEKELMEAILETLQDMQRLRNTD